MIDGAFCVVPGVGPARERQLRSLGIHRWSQFPVAGLVLSAPLDQRIREWLPVLQAQLDDGAFELLAARLPSREHWRLLPPLADQACHLDIETGDDGRVTVIGCHDAVRGPRLYVRGHNLGAFVRDPLGRLLVTFNGASFDLPVLRRTFPGWQPPALHVDLRTVTGRLGERGGLKAITARWGLDRSAAVTGLGGADAPRLWSEFVYRGDHASLSTLLEYNLYDVVQLPLVAAVACERLATLHGLPWTPPPLDEAALVEAARVATAAVMAHAARIVPDQHHPEESRSLRLEG